MAATLSSLMVWEMDMGYPALDAVARKWGAEASGGLASGQAIDYRGEVVPAEKSMSRTVYVNGEYLPEKDGKISIFDRGFLFADGVYEVTAVVKGKFIDYGPHVERLER